MVICRKCKIDYPTAEGYFYTSYGKYRNTCKQCSSLACKKLRHKKGQPLEPENVVSGWAIRKRLAHYSVNNSATGCCEWIGGKRRRYGALKIWSKTYVASRLAWEVTNGPILNSNVYVLHKCDNPSCINVKHLFLGTAKDNAIDMVNKGRTRWHNQRRYRGNEEIEAGTQRN